MTIAAALLLALLQTSPAPGVAAERVAGCGLGRVTARYVEALQSEILEVVDAADPTDAQLACADSAADPYMVAFPPAVQQRFDAIRRARESVAAADHARDWLSARGLLARVPRYEPGKTDDAVFARRAESLCGARARGALQTQAGPHVVGPEWLAGAIQAGDSGSDAIQCLLNVTTAAGFRIGFVGNEAFAD